MKILHLTLKKKWFDMIASGEKKEEYREIKDYWTRRLCTKDTSDLPFPDFVQFDEVSANLGYSRNCPNVTWKYLETRIGNPNPEWCESKDIGSTVFILPIGEIVNNTIF